jgi:hypothetical protein
VRLSLKGSSFCGDVTKAFGSQKMDILVQESIFWDIPSPSFGEGNNRRCSFGRKKDKVDAKKAMEERGKIKRKKKV